MLGHKKRLGKKLLDLAGPSHGHLLIFAKLVDTQDGDDVLQVLVSLQCFLDHLRYIVMILAYNPRIKNPRSRGQRIHRGIDAYLGECPRKHGRSIEMSKGGSWSRIGQIIRRNINRLDRSNRALLSGSNSLLQLAHLRSQIWLITYR